MKKIFSMLVSIFIVTAITGLSMGQIYTPPVWPDASYLNYGHSVRGGSAAVENSITSDYVADVYGTTQNLATVNAALTAIGANNAVLRLTAGTWTITDNLTIPANVTLKPERGAVLTISTTKTLTINGGLEGGLYQIFSCVGTGKVVLGTNSAKEILPEWWYDGLGDWSPAIQAAASCRTTGQILVRLSIGTYACKTKVLPSIYNGVHIKGSGKHATYITFNPTGTQTLFQFGDGTTALGECSLTDLSIIGAVGNVQTKTYVNLQDARRFQMQRVYISDEPVTGYGSVGLYFQGRDLFALEDCHIICDRPIVIGANPNAAASKIVLDGSRFDTVELCTYDTNGKNIEVESTADLWISHFSLRKVHMNTGAYGFYWVPSVSLTTAPLSINFQDCRYERSTGISGCTIDLSGAGKKLYGLTMTNCSWSGPTGIKLRMVANTTLKNCDSGPDNTTYLDANSSDGVISVENCYWNYGTLSLGVSLTSQTIAIDKDAKTLTRGAGSWITSGITVGSKAVLKGCTTVANDGVYVISNVEALVLTYTSGPATTNEAGTGTQTFSTVMRKTFATEYNQDRTAGDRWYAQYVAGTDIANKGILINGVRTWYWRGPLAAGEILTLPIASDANSAAIFITGFTADGSTNKEGAHWIIGHGGGVQVVGTSNCVIGWNTANKLCMYNSSSVVNNLANALDVVIRMEWYSPSD